MKGRARNDQNTNTIQEAFNRFNTKESGSWIITHKTESAAV